MKMRRKPGGEKRPDDFATALRLGRPRLMGSGRLPATLHRRYLVLENPLPLKHSRVMKERHDHRGGDCQYDERNGETKFHGFGRRFARTQRTPFYAI